MRVSPFVFGFLAVASSTSAVAHPQSPTDHVLEGGISQLRKRGYPKHTYTFQELQPHTNNYGPFRQPYFRFLILFKRRPDITEEWFHEHWASIHADLTMSLEGTGMRLSRYVQFHQDQIHLNQIAPMLVNGMSVAPYSGIAEFHAPDVDHVKQFFAGAWSNTDLSADMQKFVDMTNGFQVMAGYDRL